MKTLLCSLITCLFCSFLTSTTSFAQERTGAIAGTVRDSRQGLLPGARIELSPKDQVVVSNSEGQFTFLNLAPGSYTLKVSYIGFDAYSLDVVVKPGQTVRADSTLNVAMQNESVTVRGERERGEVEALNVERTADNIVQVLPAEVITSLPNTNIADAVGRLPSVSLERDEGEGKYIQIRGTEPRLSNVTINGIHMPSPEKVRNVKLDVIPSDLVESIEVSKTLSATQDADAIGGSVDLLTKTPGDLPYVTVLGMGGYTPISGGRYLNQFTGTVGNRFGKQKKIGLLFGGSYDYNARGINDIEPAPTNNVLPDGSTFFGPNTADLRDYQYDRTRYGFAGTADYKLGQMSSVYFRGLFSRFNDFGDDWIYSPGISNFVQVATDPNNSCGLASSSSVQGCGGLGFNDVHRKPSQRIFSTQLGARHVFGGTWVNYEVALSQAKYEGGFPRASFDGPGVFDGSNSVAFGVDVSNPFTPKFPVLNGASVYDPTQYFLTHLSFQNDKIFERDVVGAISVAHAYSTSSHYGSIEFGFKGWDARKSELDEESGFGSNTNPAMSLFLSSFHDSNYYFNQYQFGPTTNYGKILSFFNANPGLFSGGYDPVASLPNDSDTTERIWAGYVMNTISFGKLRLQTGLRIEGTQDDVRGVNLVLDSNENFQSFSPTTASNSYVNYFPSVQAQYRFSSDTVLRASYGIGIARPNFSDLVPFISFDPTVPVPVSTGNPDLKPTHAQNFDILAEHYLKPFGIIQGGIFYKDLTDPIYLVTTTRTTAPYTGLQQTEPVNGSHAHVGGIEMAWRQTLSFLPGAMNGLGVSANYSYTTSRASFPNGFGRTDRPALIRQAPNNWNFDITYDKRGISARMGLTHNDGYIWSYGFQDGAPGGVRGPLGDTYLYPHTQVDAQVSYWIPRSHGLQAIVSLLNLNNEVFGFYNGSEQFPIQREYYSRTVSAGIRWTLQREEK